MPNGSEQPEDSSATSARIDLNEDLETWLRFQESTNFFGYDHGLLVISCPGTKTNALVAGTYLVTRYGLAMDDGTPRVSKFIVLLPPGAKADLARQEILNIIATSMARHGAGGFVPLLPAFCEFRSLINLDAGNLIASVAQLPPQVACSILGADLYRFGNIAPSAEPDLTDDLAESHVRMLLERLSPLVREHRMLFFAFCNIPIAERLDFSALEVENCQMIEYSIERPRAPSAEQLQRFAQVFREGGWPDLGPAVNAEGLSLQSVGISLFELFAEEQAGALSWNVIEPHLEALRACPSRYKLFAAKEALAAGQEETSGRLLLETFQEGFGSPEEAQNAHMLADRMRMFEVADNIASQLSREHPNNSATLWVEFFQNFRMRDFATALAIAERLGSSLHAAQCRGFLSARLDMREFISESRKAGGESEALLACAEEALFRQRLIRATVWARRIPENDPFFDRACLVRLRVLRTAFHKIKRKGFADELMLLMRLIAADPKRISQRLELERLLETHLEEPLVKTLLTAILFFLLGRQSKCDEKSVAFANELSQKFDFTKGAQTTEQFASFGEEMEKWLAEGHAKRIVIGVGSLPDAARELAGPTLVGFLAQQVMDFDTRKNLEESAIGLHILSLTCDVVGDPNTAYEAALGVIEYQGVMGGAQEARNLGDHILQNWSNTQPPYSTWRISQGWAALSEACLRTNNALASLRYLCLSLLAHEGPAFSVELLRRWYRLAARIMRNLRLAPLSLQFANFERSLLQRIGASQDAFFRLDVSVLQTEVASQGTSPTNLLAAFERADKMLNEDIESEIPPLLTLQASILRILGRDNISSGLTQRFDQRVSGLPQSLQQTINATTKKKPTRTEVAALIESIPNAQDYEYLAYHTAPILPAILNALSSSVQSGDEELFLLASGVLSQPALGVRSMAVTEPQVETANRSLLRWVSSENLRAGIDQEAERYSFQALTRISVEQLQHCLDSEEAVLIVTGEPGGMPYSMLISRSSISKPELISNWSPEALDNWLQTYKEQLRWKKPLTYLPGIDSLQPPVSEIRQIFAKLSLQIEPLPERLTIIPSSALFGFTWQLSPKDNNFLGEVTRLAIAPSASWLVVARSYPWSGTTHRKAWLGSPNSTNSTLVGLRDRVIPCLEQSEFLISSEEVPLDFAGSEIVFIGAHGGVGVRNYFRTVSDDISTFSPKQFAQLLSGCGCVVLAVCSGGRSDSQSGSEETLGLLSHLFNVGVRCVIASPWPLDIDVMQYWLPTFLPALIAGLPVWDAAMQAQQALRRELDHPCAWAQMHIYGDQNFLVSRR